MTFFDTDPTRPDASSPYAHTTDPDDARWEAGLWTVGTRQGFLDSAGEAIRALQAYVAMVAAANGPDDEERIDESERSVRARLLAMSDAEFDYSSTIGPCGTLTAVRGDDPADGEDQIDPMVDHGELSVLVRHDFRVISEAQVLEAGRAAYRSAWPDDSAEAAAEDVSHLGRALYQITHNGGVESLNDVPGLVPVAGVAVIVGHGDLLTPADLESDDIDPTDLFHVEGDVLHMEVDL